MLRRHLVHHGRFYLAVAAGIAAFVVARSLDQPLRLVVAGDAFFAAYLIAIALLSRQPGTVWLRRRARYEDEGIFLILLMTLTAVGLRIGSIFALLEQAKPAHAAPLVLAGVSILLGWLTFHTMFAFHYAHIYYRPADDGIATGSGEGPAKGPAQADDCAMSAGTGGLAFPATREPGVWDFLYYSFVVGMTAQVSDVDVETTRLRRLTLLHGVVAFFYNTVILALAVNVAAG